MKKFLLIATVITALVCNSAQAATPDELYDYAWKLISKKYVDPTNNYQDWSKWRYKYKNKLQTFDDCYVAIDTMLASLNDPYTKFLNPKEFAEETSSIKGSSDSTTSSCLNIRNLYPIRFCDIMQSKAGYFYEK